MEGGKGSEVGGACGPGKGESRGRSGVEGRGEGASLGKGKSLGGRVCWGARERRRRAALGWRVSAVKVEREEELRSRSV